MNKALVFIAVVLPLSAGTLRAQKNVKVEPLFPQSNSAGTIAKSAEELQLARAIAEQVDAVRKREGLPGIHRIATFDTHPMCEMPYSFRPMVQNRMTDELLAQGGSVFYTFDSKSPIENRDDIKLVATRYEASHNSKLALAVEVCRFSSGEDASYLRVVVAYLSQDLKLCETRDCTTFYEKK